MEKNYLHTIYLIPVASPHVFRVDESRRRNACTTFYFARLHSDIIHIATFKWGFSATFCFKKQHTNNKSVQNNFICSYFLTHTHTHSFGFVHRSRLKSKNPNATTWCTQLHLTLTPTLHTHTPRHTTFSNTHST